jgi:hypothetical protein
MRMVLKAVSCRSEQRRSRGLVRPQWKLVGLLRRIWNRRRHGPIMDRLTHARNLSEQDHPRRRRHNEAPQRRMREAAPERSQDPEYRRRLRETCARRSQDPEYLRRLSEAIQEMWQDPEYRRRIGEAQRETWRNPELRTPEGGPARGVAESGASEAHERAEPGSRAPETERGHPRGISGPGTATSSFRVPARAVAGSVRVPARPSGTRDTCFDHAALEDSLG